MASRFQAWLLLVGLLLIIGIRSAQAGSSQLDPSFGSHGVVTTAVLGGNDYAGAVALPGDDKIVVAGGASDGAGESFAVARYDAKGRLDPNFGIGGKVTTAFGEVHDDVADALVLQPDGKIVAAGVSFNGAQDTFALARYNPDGLLDLSFGNGGKVRTAFGSHDDAATALALQTDGKIVAAGYSDGPGYDFALARYNPDGSLDSTFGTDGRVTTDFGSYDDYALGMALQPDGKIVAAGPSESGEGSRFALARYNADGSLDPAFGTAGKVTTVVGIADNVGGLSLQADGKIVVAGSTLGGAGHIFALVRYRASGSLDVGFGIGGIVTTPVGTDGLASEVAVEPGGKIIAAGYSSTHDTAYQFAAVRYRPSGALDPAFGNGGIVTTSIGPGNAAANDLALQSDGKIILAGISDEGQRTKFALARYLAAKALTCRVPRLRGKRLVTAKHAAAKAHCSIGRVRRAFSGTVRQGHVISQNPRAGTRRPKGAKIALVVSRGQKRRG